NQGTVAGEQIGIEVEGIANVTNEVGGLIEGGSGGVFGYNPSLAIVNAGTIHGGDSDGVALFLGGSVTNTASGVIVGGLDGIHIFGYPYGGVGTVTNAGTIVGGRAAAVQFGSGNDRLVVDPGALFIGKVDGGGGHNTLELAGGGVGALAGLGTQFVDFASIAVDAGADWTLTGNSAIANGVTAG